MTTKPIPRWKLERFVLGELPDKERSEIDRLIRESPEAARTVEEIRRSDAELRRRFPAEAIVPEIITAASQEREPAAAVLSRRSLRRFLVPALPLAAAAGLLFFVMIRETPENRLKGATQGSGHAKIEVYRKASPSAITLKDGDAVRAGDLLQIAYFSAGKPYGVIASLDGRGAVTLHFPDSETKSPRLAAGPQAKLETSYELDDAPGFERFFFITADSEIDIRETLGWIAALAQDQSASGAGRIPLSPGRELFSIYFRKERLP